MEKKHFFLKLISKRPTFPQDITPEEREIMQIHSNYWMDFMNKGILLMYGPVNDPKGTFGMAVVEVDKEDDIKPMIENDPAVINGLGTYEFYPMKAITPKK